MSLKIKSQSTPNPNARKYVVNKDILREGKVTLLSPDQCEHVPLAWSLMTLPAVVQVYIFENTMTLTQDGHGDWDSLDTMIRDAITAYMPDHDPEFEVAGSSTAGGAAKRQPRQDSPELDEIDAILDRTIRPALQADGGDMQLIGYEKPLLSIQYEGACGTCPSSMYGTLQAIQSTLRDEFDPHIEVVVV